MPTSLDYTDMQEYSKTKRFKPSYTLPLQTVPDPYSTLSVYVCTYLYVDKTWSLPFDTWQVCVFLAPIAAVQYVAKKHRRAMYQKAVAMFYIVEGKTFKPP